MFSCKKEPAYITINGHITTNKKIDFVTYTNPINGSCFWGFSDTTQIDTSGCFQIKLKLEQSAIVQLKTDLWNNFYLIIEPNQTVYEVDIDLTVRNNKLQVNSSNSEGQKIINNFETYPPTSSSVLKQYDSDTISPQDILIKINRAKEKELNPLSELLENNIISQQFYNTAQIDRDCYYNLLWQNLMFIKYRNAFASSDNAKLSQLRPIIESISNDKKANSPQNLNATFLVKQLETSCRMSILRDLDYNIDSMMSSMRFAHDNGEIYTKTITQASSIFNKDILEYFEASYLYYRAYQKDYEKELIVLFDNFKEQFPNSPYLKYVETVISPISQYHEKLDKDFSSHMKFIDNAEKLNTLNDVIAALKGKRIFIDVWATTCGPCKEEFSYSKSLDSMLQRYNVETLFISMDKDRRESQWKNMIKYYDLNGLHMRANTSLNKDLAKLFGREDGAMIIPWYILINEKGKIIKLHASRPSQQQKLEHELKALL